MEKTQNTLNPSILNPILCGLAAFGIFSTSIYLPALPQLVQFFKTDQASVQLTLTTFFVGAALGQLLLGPLTDYFGRLRIAYCGILVFMFATVASTFTESITTFIFWRFIQGVAGSTGPLLSRAIARDLFAGGDLNRMLARVMMVISASPAIAPVIGGYLQVEYGWEYAFYFLSLMAGGVLLMIHFFLPETNPALRQNEIHPLLVLKKYFALFRNFHFLGYCCVLGGIFSGLFTFITMSPFIFQKQFGWTPDQYGWVTALITVGHVLGFGITGRITGIRPPSHLIVWSLLFTVAATLYMIFTSLMFEVTALHVLGFILFYLMSTSIAITNSSSSAMTLYPQSAGIAAAVIGAVQAGSGAIGSAIAGLVEDEPLTLGLCMAVTTLLSLSAFLLSRKETPA